MRATKAVLVIGACLLITQAALAGTIVYDNLAPSSPYYINYGNWFGNMFGKWEVLAGDFVPTGSGTMDELWTSHWYGAGKNELTIALLADDNGRPGAEIWRDTFTGAMGGYQTIMHVTIANGPALTVGTTYWLYCEAPQDGTTYHRWYCNNQGDKGNFAIADPPLPWTVFIDVERRALRVSVATGPKPCPGDFDCDGDRDFDDIDPFVAALGSGTCACPNFANCDPNGDGQINFDDIDPFIALLGVPCP